MKSRKPVQMRQQPQATYQHCNSPYIIHTKYYIWQWELRISLGKIFCARWKAKFSWTAFIKKYDI